jgi:hypothetical protein
MAQFVHQYVSRLLEGQAKAGRKLGVDVYAIGREPYVIDLTILTMLGVIMKQISAVAPAVTDQVWLDALNQALDASEALPWPVGVLNQVNPDVIPPPPD